MDARLSELRSSIAGCDREALGAVNRRVALVAELRALKDAGGVPFVDPEQEQRLADALVAANTGPLTEAGVRELVASLLALTKRELERRP